MQPTWVFTACSSFSALKKSTLERMQKRIDASKHHCSSSQINPMVRSTNQRNGKISQNACRNQMMYKEKEELKVKRENPFNNNVEMSARCMQNVKILYHQPPMAASAKTPSKLAAAPPMPTIPSASPHGCLLAGLSRLRSSRRSRSL